MTTSYISYVFVNPKPGFWRLGEDIIKEVEGTKFCHFAMIFYDGYDHMVYEATFPKTRKISFDEWLKEYDIVHKYAFPIPSQNKMIECKEWLEDEVGRSYALEQLVWIWFCMLFRISDHFRNKVKINGSNRLICTELGFLFSQKFFDCPGLYEEGQDSVDLREMFAITNKIYTNPVWRK